MKVRISNACVSKALIILAAVLALAACAGHRPPRVNCGAHLERINAPSSERGQDLTDAARRAPHGQSDVHASDSHESAVPEP